VVIALIPQHAERMRPPRTLAVPFELGRPLGEPGNAEVQLAVIREALALLESPEIDPVMADSDIEIESIAGNEEPWACPVSFAAEPADEASWAELVQREMRLLRPWYEAGLRDRGHTTASLSGIDLEDLPAFLAGFLEADTLPPLPGTMRAGPALKCAAEDLKAFYNEAATAQPGRATAREVERWYWNDCQAGRLVREIRERCGERDDEELRRIAAGALVPASQL